MGRVHFCAVSQDESVLSMEDPNPKDAQKDSKSQGNEELISSLLESSVIGHQHWLQVIMSSIPIQIMPYMSAAFTQLFVTTKVQSPITVVTTEDSAAGAQRVADVCRSLADAEAQAVVPFCHWMGPFLPRLDND